MKLVNTDNTIFSNQAKFIAYKNNFNKFCGYCIDDCENALARKDKQNLLVFVRKEKGCATKYFLVLTDKDRNALKTKTIQHSLAHATVNGLIKEVETSGVSVQDIATETAEFVNKHRGTSEYVNKMFGTLTHSASLIIDDDDNVIGRDELTFLDEKN